MGISKVKSCAIMQPTYLPWAGFFGMIEAVDVFVFLDDVQLTRRGPHAWHQRNRILLNGKEHWLTVPVIHDAQEQLLKDSVVADREKWRKRHLQTLQQAYGKKSCRHEIAEIIDAVIGGDITNLAELNMTFIRLIAEALGVTTQIEVSSELGVGGRKGEKLKLLCDALDAERYVAAPGSRAYLEEEQAFDGAPIQLDYFTFDPAPYEQRGASAFVSHLSIVDVICNIGLEKTRDYIRGNYE